MQIKTRNEWVTYKNGNYIVRINLKNGTKIKQTLNAEDNVFIPNLPESMDVKISNKCDMGCPMCHEASTPDGLHGEILNLSFWDTLLPYTEIAIGGGNALSHPDIIPFLEMLKEKHLIANMTVNQRHFMQNKNLFKRLVDKKMLYGIGISLTDATDEFIEAVSEFDNAVIHVINGIFTREQCKKLAGHNLKLLILGFKDFRRGVDYHVSHESTLNENQLWLAENLSDVLHSFKVVSFDNLALKQLDVKSLMTEDEWASFYMGDDGIDGDFNSASMYIDLVKKQYAANSCSTERFPLGNDVREMYGNLKQKYSKNN